jgi:threonine dehydrogenase-like Zn-dependent dehydrogenase
LRALTVTPGKPGSAQIENFKEPAYAQGSLLLRALALGVCGTDREIIDGKYGTAPAGHERLIIGHESLAVVEEAPAGSGFEPGDYVVCIVRMPDPVPCSNCAVGEWDMCRNGRFTEHGIKQLDGFARERYRVDPEYVVKIDASLGITGVLTEPTSVVAKAWEHITRIGQRANWKPRTVLVTGAGPIGLLAALIGRQQGLDVHVFDRAEHGTKVDLAHAIGATWLSGDVNELPSEYDVILECTGAASVIEAILDRTAPDGIVCLLGVSNSGHTVSIDLGAINRDVVLENRVVFGCVNANRRHYEAAARVLKAADRAWLDRMITRKVPLDRFREAIEKRDDDVKVVITFDGA